MRTRPEPPTAPPDVTRCTPPDAGAPTPPAAVRRRPPTLWTPPFVLLALASLAYFTAAGMLIPALPRYVAGPLGGGDVAVGVVFGIFSVSAVLLRPAAGCSATTAAGAR
jgi:hypothetical protein